MPVVDDRFGSSPSEGISTSEPIEDTTHDRLLTLTTPIELALVRVPAGEFAMGSNPSLDNQAETEEKPQHWLAIDEFYIGKYPVTNAQYMVFVQATSHRAPRLWRRLLRPSKISSGKDDHPVADVSWHDALAFCDWLSQETGRSFRLPTEAEWEKSARGPHGQLYPWGNVFPTPELCNFLFHVNDTTPVGKYSPRGDSPYGCADMAGNVFEWTQSLFKEYPYDAKDGREDVDAAGLRVLRGGARYTDKEFVRCAFRGRNRPQARYDDWGFRVALSP